MIVAALGYALGFGPGFTPEVDAALRRDPALVNRVAADLLDAHFAASLHHDILDAVGMPWVVDGTRRRRDPNFRREVLRIYERWPLE